MAKWYTSGEACNLLGINRHQLRILALQKRVKRNLINRIEGKYEIPASLIEYYRSKHAAKCK